MVSVPFTVYLIIFSLLKIFCWSRLPISVKVHQFPFFLLLNSFFSRNVPNALNPF